MINVAIDGPAGAGKSTVAKAVASRMGLIYLDTGAMYRATAYTALSRGIDVTDEDSVKAMLEDMSMDIAYENGVQQIYVNGVNTTPYLREHRMSKAASDISALPPVRYKMVELQRLFAASHDVVLDGRDIGTFVLPEANCKFYMTATAEERADRRYKELVEKGQQVDRDALLKDIMQRDYNDSHREVAPLKQAEDAEYLDTTNMSIDEVVQHVMRRIREKVDPHPAEAPSEVEAKEENKASKGSDRIKKYYKPLKSYGFYKFMRLILVPVQKLFWPIKLVNPQNAVKGRAIYICNHYSKVDTFLPLVKLFKKEPHILAKSELFEVPISAWFLYHMGAIPVRRGEADIDCVKCVLKLLKDDKQLMMFPDGTRNKQGTQQMAEIKSGAARFAIKTKATVVPMMYYSKPRLFRRNWLYIGEPFTLEQFYGARDVEGRHAATEFIAQKLDETRKALNEYVETLKDKKGKPGKEK